MLKVDLVDLKDDTANVFDQNANKFIEFSGLNALSDLILSLEKHLICKRKQMLRYQRL